MAGDQVELLADLLVGLLPEGPQLYPDGDLTDAPEEILVAELIREAALEGVRDELPHSIAVVVEEMSLREDRHEDKPLLDIHANLYVERDSQKGIMIGHKGVAAARRRHGGPPPDRGAARHPGLPRPARQDRQGLAARPPAAAQARLLIHSNWWVDAPAVAPGRTNPPIARAHPIEASRGTMRSTTCSVNATGSPAGSTCASVKPRRA